MLLSHTHTQNQPNQPPKSNIHKHTIETFHHDIMRGGLRTQLAHMHTQNYESAVGVWCGWWVLLSRERPAT